jgi:single-strand DNA-binding protein
MNHNLVQLGGNLARDVETKYLPSGTAIADFSIAVNRVWKDAQSGEKKEEVTFAGCTAFGKTAENIAKYFSKGDQIFVQGRLKQDTWEDKETGKKQSKTKVVVESFEFIGGKKANNATAPEPGERQPPRSIPKPAHDPDLDIAEDAVPF